jgi:RNA polymerase sigma factor (sigma-70 family)
MGYPTTRWSQVVVASGDGIPARAALAWLCERYWECLLAHARRRGFSLEDSEDLTQDFLIQVIAGSILDRADPSRGRFRTFLLACLDHHLMHAREKRGAIKRGGGMLPATFDELAMAETTPDPAANFNRDWANLVVARAKENLQATETPERWSALAPFLASNGNAQSYREVGTSLALSEGAVKVAVHRLRERFRLALREEVAQTLAEDDARLIDAELTLLLASLRNSE